MSARDEQTGIAIRFVSYWRPEDALIFTEVDHAFLIAVFDVRDLSFGDKFIDALAFLQARRIAP